MTEGLIRRNARAAILARGIKEITRLVQAVGGKDSIGMWRGYYFNLCI